MAKVVSTETSKSTRWTPRLIKLLRGTRTLAEFGALLGASRNTVSRWEAGKGEPDNSHSSHLSDLAERERFLKDWKLAGSIELLQDLGTARSEISGLFRNSVERTAHQLEE